jgi:hypothetical protein
MVRKSALALLTPAIWFCLFPGCETTEPIRRLAQLRYDKETGSITVITRDSAIYDLTRYSIKDSTLRASGYRKKDGAEESFSGNLPLSTITYIQASHADGMKTILATAAVGFVGSTVISYLSEEKEEMRLDPQLRYVAPYFGGGGGGGGTSCPFIYSWNGERYVLEAEAYGIAWGKALEMRTTSVLPSLRSDHGELNIRMSNERPETHYYNAVHLKAVETDLHCEVVGDVADNLWPVYSPLSPCMATDHSRRVITGAVATRDGKYWESDLANTDAPSTFEDTLTLSFTRTSVQSGGTLIVHAINSTLNDIVLRNLFTFLGDESLEFVRAVEHDQELIGILKDWIEDVSLKVFVWNGKEWNKMSTIHPEANSVPFARACRIGPGDFPGDTVKVRLTCLTGVWKIDAVQIDWTNVGQLNPLEVPMVSATGPGERDVSVALKSADNDYLVLLPPEKIELKFKALEGPKGKKMTYVCDVQGYLHEWIPPAAKESILIPASWMDGPTKIACLKSILRAKNAFLPPVYAEWIRSRNIVTRTDSINPQVKK